MDAREGIDSKYFPVSIGMRFGNHRIGPTVPENVFGHSEQILHYPDLVQWIDLKYVQVKIPEISFYRPQNTFAGR